MRRRNLSPAFFTNEYLVTQPFATRILFEGLWCLADREGRLEDRPVRIKMQVFPADDVDVDAALTALAQGDLITRYEVDGQKFIQVNTFGKHQHPHPREAPSVIPPLGRAKDIPGACLGVAEPGGVSGSSESQDLRSVGVQPDTPAARPAPRQQSGHHLKPLAYKPRIDVAWPGRPPVPGALHAEFIAKLGGDPEHARQCLLAWYPTAAAPYEDQAIGDDDYTFWRHRFREWVGTTKQPLQPANRAPGPSVWDRQDGWCQHEPRCSSREWHAMLIQQGGVREATA